MSDKNNEICKHFIGDGYQPSQEGYKPNGNDKPQIGHTPERSESKPTNLPKKR